MKKGILALILIGFIVPSVALASWWNPFTWKIFQKKQVALQAQVEPQKTAEEKISDLQKQLDDLKKAETSSTLIPITQKTSKLAVVQTPIAQTPVPKPVPKVDLCNNFDGVQSSVPDKMHIENGNCVVTIVDVCSNMDGVQIFVPLGMLTERGSCFYAPTTINPATPTQNTKDADTEIATQKLIAQIKTECTDPINQLKAEILQLKSDYIIKYKAIGANCQGCTDSGIQPQYDGLLRTTNQSINELNLKIQQIDLQCETKYDPHLYNPIY